MSLRSRLSGAVAAFRGNPLDNPAVPLSAAPRWLYSLFGAEPTSAGVAVNEQTAMQLDAVYSCINVITSDVSSLPLKVYRRTKKGKRPAIETDLYGLLTVSPNPEMTAPVFFSTWLGSALLTGNGYVEIQRDDGQAVALWPRHPRHVRPRRAKPGELFDGQGRDLAGDLVYEVTDTGTSRIVRSQDMLHLKGLSVDGWLGLSPIQAARQTIGTAIAAGKFGGGWFGRGSRPSGLLTGPINEKDTAKNTQARESWEAANSGDNQGRTAVMPTGWSWTAIGISPKDAQFMEIQQYTAARIAGLYRVPPHMIGDTSRLSNSNHESQALEYVTFTLRPWLARIEAEIQSKLMPKVGRSANLLTVRFDVSELIRGDFASQMTGFATGKQWGFYNTNMILEALGLNPIGPEGDIFYVPLNMVPMGQEPGTGSNANDGDQQDVKPNEGEDAQDGVPAGNGGRNQRLLLDRMGLAYGGIFRDAAGRLVHRGKRDAGAVHQVFGPVLEAIAGEAERQSRQLFRLPKDSDLGTDRIVRDVCRALEKRAADWTLETSAEIDAEIPRTVKAITLGVFREAGSTVAMAA